MNLRAIFGGALPLFVLGHFSHHILTAITVPLTPFIRSAFNLDYTQSGLVVSAFMLAYGFGQLPAGWLADRIDPRKLMIVGISGVALAGILVGLSQSYGWMIVFLVLMGILAGGYHPSAPPLISASVRPENLGRALGFHNIGGGASYFLAPLVAVAIANAWGWRNAYVALGIPTVAFGIAFYILLGRLNARQKANSPPQPAEREEDGAPHRSEKRRLVVFLILTTVISATISSTFSFIPLLMVDHFGVSKEMAAASLSVPFSAVFWASPLGGYFADRFGSVRMILAVSFIAGPAIFLLTVVPFGWALGALLLLFGVIIYTRMSASESFLIHQTPVGSRSTILGIYYFTGMEGGGILTPVVGYMIDHFGFTTAFAAAGGALFTVTLICSFWLREKRE
ncbi:MAG: MFS transporter [Proteobacteria bacterium]|nr:MFS transporter [Pseudomonadota bacterium]